MTWAYGISCFRKDIFQNDRFVYQIDNLLVSGELLTSMR